MIENNWLFNINYFLFYYFHSTVFQEFLYNNPYQFEGTSKSV